ncbi:MAG: SurA N-terminal domain-containing protein, partial [Lentisphaeraceae bacterium]|nr:SurA N-terminal domain-containing protein [Lentisphaeraceae bacterium]
MNKLLLIFILIGMCSLHSQQAVYKDMILAKVNGKIITRFELEQMTQRYQRQIAQTYPKEIAQRKIAELKVSALNKFIEDIIIKDEFTTKGYKVPKAYIDKELRREIQSRTGGDRAKFIAMLDRGGLSMDEFRDQLRESLSVSMLLDENVRRKINISPIDIARFYEKNRAKFLTPLELRPSIIMISNKGRDDKQF